MKSYNKIRRAIHIVCVSHSLYIVDTKSILNWFQMNFLKANFGKFQFVILGDKSHSKHILKINSIIAETSSVIFDFSRQFFTNANIFKLKRLRFHFKFAKEHAKNNEDMKKERQGNSMTIIYFLSLIRS